MKIQFKTQDHQTDSVKAVVDCFKGQPYHSGIPTSQSNSNLFGPVTQFGNAPIVSSINVLKNVNSVQSEKGLTPSQSLWDFADNTSQAPNKKKLQGYIEQAKNITDLHLDIEMETGTGKTYAYIKTAFELNKKHGWSKFIVVVPSVAIREGVYKSLQITDDHFYQKYGKKARYFIYNSKRLHDIQSFADTPDLSIMVINSQAFNATGKDARRIDMQLDEFQSRRPIEVIAKMRPILILDEPQKLSGDKTIKNLPKFKPLFVLRYSATHKMQHLLIHRLDAVDAYNKKLVKKIEVSGVETIGGSGFSCYLYLDHIQVSSSSSPIATVEMEIQSKSGSNKRRFVKIKKGDDLHKKSKNLSVYNGYVVSQIDARDGTVEFTNGQILKIGEIVGNANPEDIRSIQIRETIRTHLEKEQTLFQQGIKVLSLFFIDTVSHYRDYTQPDNQGVYAQIFEEHYDSLVNDILQDPSIPQKYKDYLSTYHGSHGQSLASNIHKGYFSIDKKTNRLKDPDITKSTNQSDDADAYDLIMKDKERLLSLDEPTRFIFSHSALREGWDNPNVFQICALKQSNNTMSKRQEVGRGLRICVDNTGVRVDEPSTVHDINVLTVITDQSYTAFAKGLQTEIQSTLTSRLPQVTPTFFAGKTISTQPKPTIIDAQIAQDIDTYMRYNGYVDAKNNLTQAYNNSIARGSIAQLSPALAAYGQQVIFDFLKNCLSIKTAPKPGNKKGKITLKPNGKTNSNAFKELWKRISDNATYSVQFKSSDIVKQSIKSLDKNLSVTQPHYLVRTGSQTRTLSSEDLEEGKGFQAQTKNQSIQGTFVSQMKYDLVGRVAKETKLTRKTVAGILSGIKSQTFTMFKINPDHFIQEAVRLIDEVKLSNMVAHISYAPTGTKKKKGDIIKEQSVSDVRQLFTHQTTYGNTIPQLKKSIYDDIPVDSSVETQFALDLEADSRVTVYTKLPTTFIIPTPLGGYNPDWAIAFTCQDAKTKQSVQHVYFVAETKSSTSKIKLRTQEQMKIDCAKEFFQNMQGSSTNPAKYDVVTNVQDVINIIQQKHNICK